MTNKKLPGPGSIHRRMIEVLKRHPDGLTFGEWREALGLKPQEQGQLDRRKRDLNNWFEIRKAQKGGIYKYFYVGLRDKPISRGPISQKVRAEVFHNAHGRCAMCGRTVERHGITLVVDHKIPIDWGGSNDRDNLWAICEDCNAGKKNYFASQDQALMREIMGIDSIHVRIGEALKAYIGKPVPSYLIEFIGGQDDWRKRLRELRYLGWIVTASKKKDPSGRVKSYYTLTDYKPWPENPSRWIQEYERDRAQRNKKSTR